MDVSKETEKDIAQLQVLEQNIQALMMQRQNFQMQLTEVENALKELESTKEKPFKLVGNIMVESTKEDLKKDLSSKKEVLELRIKNYESQEEKIKKKVEELQKSIMGSIEKGGVGNDRHK